MNFTVFVKPLVVATLILALTTDLMAQPGLTGIRNSWAEAARVPNDFRMQSEQSKIAREAYYHSFGAHRGSAGHARIRVSGRAGGVLVGLPPEPIAIGAPLEPLGIPKFKFELNDTGSPEVRFIFETAGMDSWQITCHPIVPVLATAVACDDIPLLYTLTGIFESTEEANFVDLLFAALGEEKSPVQISPKLYGSRFAFRPAVLDLFADSRSPWMYRNNVSLANVELTLVRLAVKIQNGKIDKKDTKLLIQLLATYDSNRDIDYEVKDFLSSLATEEVLAAMQSAATSEPVFKSLEVFRNSVDDRELREKINSDDLLRPVVDAFRAELHKAIGKAKVGQDGKVLWDASPFLLSIVEEQPWTLSKNDLTVPNVMKDPSSSVIAFKHRIAYRNEDLIQNMKDEGIKLLFQELPSSQRLTESIHESMSTAELEMLQEYNQFIVLHRIVHAVLNKQIINFPAKEWESMLKECSKFCEKNVDNQAEDTPINERASSWHEIVRFSRTLDWDELAPQIPESLRLR